MYCFSFPLLFLLLYIISIFAPRNCFLRSVVLNLLPLSDGHKRRHEMTFKLSIKNCLAVYLRPKIFYLLAEGNV